MIPMNHRNDLIVNQGCSRGLHLGSNRQLSNWTSGYFNKRETMHGLGNLVNYPGQGKSWILEENYNHHFTKPE